ncbi:2-hydroxyacid dehydrogenase [Trichoderma arundinaceum]|uniref:2-hydroxyacid dehydrogenase n=1 Tax=Trichoderma arundinaceum TaxID=490622 RepID=A0A395NBK0_TRIAR|nr:2-hydroxyacid dehydrogenase [Trichoderma arundinaceum]
MGAVAQDKRPRVAVLGSVDYVGDEYLEAVKAELDIEFLSSTSRQELQQELPRSIAQSGPVDALIVVADTPRFAPVNGELLSALAPHCRVIASAWAGYNEFDVSWMTSQGIWFCNTVDAVAEATADLAIFLTLSVVRNTYVAEKRIRAGGWYGGIVPTRDTAGMTLGIVGMGSIGKYLSVKAKTFNMKVKYYNRKRLSEEVEARCQAEYCSSLEELLSQADVVSINCPLTPETRSLISHAEFKLMKDGVFLINTARGPIVDEEALIAALESGKVARAGLDVFNNEPHINDYFKTSDKVVLQPHMGGWTTEAIRRAERECFENVLRWKREGKPVSPVNEV